MNARRASRLSRVVGSGTMQRRDFLFTMPAGAALALPGAALAQQSADIEAVTAAHHAFYRALSARDLEAMAALWSRRPDLVHAGPLSKAPIIGPREAVTDYFNTIFDYFSKIDVKADEIAAIRVGGDIAWLMGAESGTLTLAAGGESARFRGLVTNVYERTDGKWLLVAHHSSQVRD